MKKTEEITGEQVRTLRGNLMLTQEEFAKEIGVSPQTVNRWEQDKAKPSFLSATAIKKLCEKKGEKLN